MTSSDGKPEEDPSCFLVSCGSFCNFSERGGCAVGGSGGCGFDGVGVSTDCGIEQDGNGRSGDGAVGGGGGGGGTRIVRAGDCTELSDDDGNEDSDDEKEEDDDDGEEMKAARCCLSPVTLESAPKGTSPSALYTLVPGTFSPLFCLSLKAITFPSGFFPPLPPSSTLLLSILTFTDLE